MVFSLKYYLILSFLAEGTAIQDLFKSDRVLVGGDETKMEEKQLVH